RAETHQEPGGDREHQRRRPASGESCGVEDAQQKSPCQEAADEGEAQPRHVCATPQEPAKQAADAADTAAGEEEECGGETDQDAADQGCKRGEVMHFVSRVLTGAGSALRRESKSASAITTTVTSAVHTSGSC